MRRSFKHVRAARSIWIAVWISLGLVIFYHFEWTSFRVLIQHTVILCISSVANPVAISSTSFSLDSVIFEVTPECTYLDLLICLLPLCWRERIDFRSNCIFCLSIASLICFVNLIRLNFLVLASTHGIEWTWAHDLPDTAIWYGALALGVVSRLRTALNET